MNQITQQLINDLLLGKLNDEQEQELWLNIINSKESALLFTTYRDELMEDYLDELLNEEDSARFENNFLIFEENRKLYEESSELTLNLRRLSQKKLVEKVDFPFKLI